MIETFICSFILCSNGLLHPIKRNRSINILNFYNEYKMSGYNKGIHLKVPILIFQSKIVKNLKRVFWEEANDIIERLLSDKSCSEISCLFLYDRFVFMMRGYAPIKCFCLQDVCRDIAWFYNQCNTTFPLLF